MSEGDVSLACASLLVDELVRGGMTDACISPGSRSTPIALALARHPVVRVHVHLDERASAFFALGLSKATGRAVGVVSTSGTAAVNFWPAVVEAAQARVPLVLLTADRPPELRGTGANQTIDQVELYGKYVRAYFETPLPAEGPETGLLWRRFGRDALTEAYREPRAPVHLNLPFREPLVPAGDRIDLGPAEPEPPGAPITTPSEEEVAAYDRLLLDATARFLQEFAGARGLILAGGTATSPHDEVRGLGWLLNWPVVAEPTSGLRLTSERVAPASRALSAGQALLASESWLAAHMPEVVLQVGATPTSRATQRLVSSVGRLAVVERHALDPDPDHRAALRASVDPTAFTKRLLEDLRTPFDANERWFAAWEAADAVARRAVDGLLDSWEEPFEGRVARDLPASIRDGSALVVGSSMPIRDLDFYMAPRPMPDPYRDPLRVIANRGASGIDGFVSTVLGVATSCRPTYALCGDLTLLHDAGSLLWSATRGSNAVLVVLNNDGGAVFSFLPQRELPEFEDLFVTPHGLEVAKLATAAGAGHVRIERAGDLVSEVARAASAGGVWIVEVPSDRELNVARHAEVGSTVAEALARM